MTDHHAGEAGKELISLTLKELVLLYTNLKKKPDPDPAALERLVTRIEKILYDHMTIEEIESIDVYYRTLK